MKVSALVIDDEPLARSRLARLLRELNVDVLAQGSDGSQAIELLTRFAVDMLFIDINMPVKDGLTAASEIVEKMERPPSIVFCTAYDRYAVEAFKTNASAYILKPVSRDDLSEVIKRASIVNRMQMNNLDNENKLPGSLAIGFEQVVENIDCDKIIYFRSFDKHVYAYLEGRGEVLVDFTLKELESRFSAVFIRCHRSTLLNRSYLSKLERDSEGKSFVHLKSADEVFQVSRRHLTDVKKCFR